MSVWKNSSYLVLKNEGLHLSWACATSNGLIDFFSETNRLLENLQETSLYGWQWYQELISWIRQLIVANTINVSRIFFFFSVSGTVANLMELRIGCWCCVVIPSYWLVSQVHSILISWNFFAFNHSKTLGNGSLVLSNVFFGQEGCSQAREEYQCVASSEKYGTIVSRTASVIAACKFPCCCYFLLISSQPVILSILLKKWC